MTGQAPGCSGRESSQINGNTTVLTFVIRTCAAAFSTGLKWINCAGRAGRGRARALYGAPLTTTGHFLRHPNLCTSCSLGHDSEFLRELFLTNSYCCSFLCGLFIFSAPLCENCLADGGTYSELCSEKEPRFPTKLNSNVTFLFPHSVVCYLLLFQTLCLLRSLSLGAQSPRVALLSSLPPLSLVFLGLFSADY